MKGGPSKATQALDRPDEVLIIYISRNKKADLHREFLLLFLSVAEISGNQLLTNFYGIFERVSPLNYAYTTDVTSSSAAIGFRRRQRPACTGEFACKIHAGLDLRQRWSDPIRERTAQSDETVPFA